MCASPSAPLRRVDGLAKVKGTAVYGDDITLPGMLYGVCRFADIPAGKIEAIDLSEALNVAGVVKIATWQDIPGTPVVGIIVKDYLPIVKDEVVFHGDVVAVVAATSYEAACEAADKIHVRYTPYEPLTDVEAALAPDARRIHPDRSDNIAAHHHTVKGDIAIGFAEASHVIEREYEVGFQEHAYIEPEVVLTWLDPTDGSLIISGSIQNPHRVRSFVAKFMGCPQSQINVKRAVMGGSFGGKDDIIDHLACRSALMTRLTGRPVKFTYTREQSIIESCKRHPYKMKYRAGVDDNGRILAIKIDILADSGGYAASSPFVTWRSSVQAAGPYNIDNVHIDVKAVYTNNSYTSAMRGFGSPQVVYANESFMDEIAEALNLSPVAVREVNALRQGDTSVTGQRFDKHTVSAIEVLTKAVNASEFAAKRQHYRELNQKGGVYRYGIGLALSYRGCSIGAEGVDTSTALIQVNEDGSVNLATSVSENGQGLQTAMSLIAAEAFGIPLSELHFMEPPTSVIGDGGSTAATRGTMVGGGAILDAADKIKRRILSVVGDSIGTRKLAETLWQDGFIINVQDSERRIDFKTAVNKTKWASVSLTEYGWFVPPPIHWDEEKGCGSPYFTWVYGCQVAEVRVNTSTGKTDLLHVTAAHDVGRVLNPVGFEGQVYGGVAQGFGYALLEDFNIENGQVKSENFDSYLLPTMKDIPPMTIIGVENPDIAGPLGAKGIGEPATELAAAAINNAVSFALETRFNKLPLTLEQVILGYNLKKPVRQSEMMLEAENKKQVLRLTDVEVTRAKSLQEALTLLAQEGVTAIAGGTDVIVQGRLQTRALRLVDISRLPELTQVSEDPASHEVIIGGAMTFNRITDHPLLRERYPLLAQACHTVGSHQIRNRATIGGNIVNAAPCGDSIPPAILYDARIELRSLNGVRTLGLGEFLLSGYKTQRQPDELLTKVILPPPARPRAKGFYHQLGRRNALNITRQSLSALLDFADDGTVSYCRLVDGALFSKPQRLLDIERCLLGKPLNSDTINSACEVLDKLIYAAIGKRWSAAYKQPVFVNMFRDMMAEAQRASGI
ncbi:molybdopterin cofactor-binding domain-containing protein [Klebsiella aerogenes]|uniref:molybdopterin cofactor-binding domain-containing protein n=1 Tax=Klebsiella aerogenes TaxID=548 RepID=UPI000F7D9FC1|nr:molybdopterin cofactor-binding domain-containing protein [Klebsiella aerogenes]EKU7808442.1 molybdopterin-dependent oxidoreductase [Klebsiella aerogenes]EKW3262058.1 molybdopterin-dependent oxidoreductase [Klebsiella aerogenes]RSV86663.1 aldehyde oxidase [Klebsiella aerogenes]HBY9710323.1 molybdopterin-dependent oxidoreductase [Klebsiella aerogenes]HDH0720442.1 molybdopterin-dependent oxidoreductase [Klebsiella aerogenes]